ncbi:hypothetical protein [Desulfospira joergensenii]|uniref:hypothetical protein n=1 Tax=Desulfospira joergensenii TaxID=53329 RepID=UPI000419891E|nr:hypothetical protein [Desulfospira joergensenii]
MDWIKKGLDPGVSYIVFENETARPHGSALAPRIYEFLEQEKIGWQQVIDMDLSREYLVVKVRPGREDRILGKIMGCGIPEKTIYTVYKAEEV